MNMPDNDKHDRQTHDEENPDHQIEKTLEKKSKLDVTIKLETSNAEIRSKELNHEIELEENKIEEKSSDVNNKISKFSTGAKKFFDDSITLSNNTLDKFGDISRSLLKKLYFVLGIFAAVFTASYYYFIGLVYEPTIIVGFITFIAILVTILKTVSSFNNSITKARRSNLESITKLQESSLPVIKEELKIEPDFNSVKKNRILLFAGLEKIFGAVKEYVPATDEHYSSKERRTRQKYFAQTLKNALEEYWLSSPISDKYLMERFGPPTNSTEEWLEKAAKQLSVFLETNPAIVKLCYFDYIGDSAGLKDIWKEIRDTELLDRLTTILMKKFGVKTQTLNGKEIFIDIINGLEVFTLNDFSDLYNRFYLDLEKEKKLLLQILTDLGFQLKEDDESRIKNFLPTSKDYDKWFIELVTEASHVLSFDFNLLWLLYLDRIGDIGKKATVWNSIRRDEKLLHALSDILIGNGLIQFNQEYDKSNLTSLVYDVVKGDQSFDTIQINRLISQKIQTISRTKSLFSFSLEAKNCPIPEIVRSEYDKMLINDEPIDVTIAKKLEKTLEIPYTFILLFYYDYTQNIPQRKSLFKTISNDAKAYDLMKFLIQKNLIATSEKDEGDAEGRTLEKISSILGDFDLEILRRLYTFYKNLMNESKNLTDFLTDEEIRHHKTITLDKLIEIYGKTLEPSRYKTIEKLAGYIIKKEQNRVLTDEEFSSLIATTIVLFFDKYYDLSKEDACKSAAGHELSIKMLYFWIKKTSKEQFAKMKISIGSILEQALNDEKIDIDISEFKTRLEEGVLISSEKQLWGMRFDRVDKGLEKISQDERYRKILGKFSDSLTILMNTKINNDFIVQALNSQAISAYMITRNSGAVIEVVDEYLEGSCLEMSSTDSRFKNLYLIEPKSPTTGISTRVGLVPLNIENFDEFSDLFSRAFNRAVSKKGVSDISANLIRIFPSDLTFKPLQPGGTRHDPVEAIKNLMMNKLGTMEKIKITASAQKSQPPEVALRDVISNLVNSRTKIYTIIEDYIIDISNTHPKLSEFLKSQEYDSQLEKHYSVSGLIELANKLHNLYKANPDETVNSFTKTIELILKERKIELNQTEIQQLSNVTLNNLTDLGFILNSNSVIT